MIYFFYVYSDNQKDIDENQYRDADISDQVISSIISEKIDDQKS